MSADTQALQLAQYSHENELFICRFPFATPRCAHSETIEGEWERRRFSAMLRKRQVPGHERREIEAQQRFEVEVQAAEEAEQEMAAAEEELDPCCEDTELSDSD